MFHYCSAGSNVTLDIMLQNLVKSQPVFIEKLMNFGMVTNQFISHCIRLLELKGFPDWDWKNNFGNEKRFLAS